MSLPFSVVKSLNSVRNLIVPNYSDASESSPNINNRGEMLIAHALPSKAELTRLGSSWISISTTVAPVAAIPTTAAHASLWNGEADGGKSYVIDRLGFLSDVSAGAVITLTLLYTLGKSHVAATAGAILISSLSGKPNYTGKGQFKAATTVVDTGWYPVGDALISSASTATIGMCKSYEINGGLIIPPGAVLGLATFASSAGANTNLIFAQWHEAQLVLG